MLSELVKSERRYELNRRIPLLREEGNFARFVVAACTVGVALGLKAFYSRAGATELLWILAPSAWLARSVGGIDLAYEQGVGFISHTHHLVVGSACAGVNFLIICFLCLYFSFARHFSSKTLWFAHSLLISYVATVAANGLRIFVSAHLWNADIYGGWITADQMHRLAGTAIYYASLLALYFAVDSRVGARAHRIAPLFWYVAISLGVPLAGRVVSQGTPGFAAHATWVMAVVLVLTMVAVLPRIPRTTRMEKN
jgi:exosortase K